MNILIVDASKKQAYVNVLKNEDNYSITLNEREKHSEALLPTIDEVLGKASLELKDIDVFAVVAGPGSFTGLRVALSTIKAFQFVYQKKIVSVNSFEPFLQLANNGVVLLNSTSSTFYYATMKKSIIDKMGVISFTECDKLIKNKPVYMLSNEKYTELKDYNVQYVDNYNDLLIKCVLNKVHKNEYINENELEPNYLQLSQAEQQLNHKKEQL